MTEDTNEHTEFQLNYAESSKLTNEGEQSVLSLFGNIQREPVRFKGSIKDPIQLREALISLSRIVGSDYRYVPKDRSVYQAYRRMRNASANLGAWEAQQAYFTWLAENDPLAFIILDPLVSVHPDELGFEVFSKDEGTYAKLSLSHELFTTSKKKADAMQCGTTNIDFSEKLVKGILQFRSYRDSEISIQHEAVKVATDSEEVLEKKIKLPDSWLRGFLQVQSSMMMPADSFTIAPLDLYNVLRQLRMHADQKGKRRGLRVELIPGEIPNLVLEPWETLIPSTSGEVYKGKQAKVIRVWGRRRLMLLQKFLPYCHTVEVKVIGSGLPSFWILKGKDISLTLGLTGFTASNWSKAASFDLLLPRETNASKDLAAIIKHLAKVWVDSKANIAKATKLKASELLALLQQGCANGQLMYDISTDQYRLRPLTEQPLDLEKLEFRNNNDRAAHDLLERKSAVHISTENRIHGSGTEITGKVSVEEDKREYRPQMLINDDGFSVRAECTCNQFRSQGLKHGPCVHLIALRIAHAQREALRKTNNKARNTITMETRTFSRRKHSGEDQVQITLDRNKLRLKWGKAGAELRSQQLQFNSVDSARNDYLKRLDSLTERGYLEA